jgi:hypothetical protein
MSADPNQPDALPIETRMTSRPELRRMSAIALSGTSRGLSNGGKKLRQTVLCLDRGAKEVEPRAGTREVINV